jgi:hypothetical protein
MNQGGAAAVGSDEPVVGSSEGRRLEERIRELERLLGRKTVEVEILKEALGRAQAKKPTWRSLSLPMGGSGQGGRGHPGRGALESGGAGGSGAAVATAISQGRRPRAAPAHPGARRPATTYGYRRITALLSRERALSAPNVNHKRVFRIMQRYGLWAWYALPQGVHPSSLTHRDVSGLTGATPLVPSLWPVLGSKEWAPR